jgi:SAM-dependent methyltransferase
MRLVPPHPVRRLGDLQGKVGVASYFDQLDKILKQVNGRVLDLGSGGRRLNDRTLNLDVVFGSQVDVVSRGEALPFRANSFDCVVVQQVLQYVETPDRLLAEVRRVLKPGATIFLEVPFLFQKNECRQDYWRWTEEGLALTAGRHFNRCLSGVSMGAGSAISSLLRWTSRALISGGEKGRHKYLWWGSWIVTGWCTFWLKYLDFLLKSNSLSGMVAAHVFYVGKKK